MPAISISKELNAHLTLLMAHHPGIQALIAFSTDGLVITSLIKEGQEKEQISALSALLLNDAVKATTTFNFGKFQRILLVSEKGYLTILNATNEIKIAMLASQRDVFTNALKDLVKMKESFANLQPDNSI
jgi:predicted regulator of Ras-like GTPase activity (Roadblock/LC7/MglB family)